MGLLDRLFRTATPVVEAIKNFHFFSIQNPKQPIWSMGERKYDQYVREAYQKNPYVYAAIRVISSAIASIPWVLFTKNDKKEIERHAVLDLIRRPNPYCGQAKFFEQVVTSMSLSGGAYIQRVGPDTGAPKELWSLQPNLVTVVAGDKTKPISRYEYNLGHGDKQIIEPEYVLPLWFYNPTDPLSGMSPIMVAAMSIDQSNASKSWNVSLLQNFGKPAGAFTVEAALKEPEFKRLKDQVSEQMAKDNLGKPLVLDGGMKYQQMSMSATDMDWLEGQKLSAREISIVFGVPPELLGDSSQKTYSNFREARKAFYEETVIPMATWIRDEFNNWLVPLFGDNIMLDIDTDSLDALAEDRDKVWARVGAADWLTVNEKRQATGYDEIPGGNAILVPLSLIPLSGALEERPEPETETEENQPPPRPEDEDEEMPVKKKAWGLTTPDAKTEYWKAVDRRRMRATEAVEPIFRKLLRGDVRASANAIRNCVSPAAFDSAIKSALDGRRKEWEEGFQKVYSTVGEEFAKTVYAGLKGCAPAEVKEDIQNRWLEAIQAWVRKNKYPMIKGISETTTGQIRSVLAEGIAEGEGIFELSKRVDAFALEPIVSNRSEMIARTEVIAASNAGSQAAAKSTGMPLNKEWISTRDDRTRGSNPDDEFDHLSMDGNAVDIDDPYNVSGEFMDFPCDVSHGASPGNTIQCRCTEGYVPK